MRRACASPRRCAPLRPPCRLEGKSYTTAVMPPSTNRMCPLTNDEASLARKIAAPCNSSTLPQRPGGRARADPGGEFLVRHQRLIELGAEIARRNAVRRDAVLGEFRAHRLGEHLHRALARRVGRDGRAAELRHHRADVDDLAARPRDHAPRDRLRDEEHRVEIGRHDLPPVGFGKFGERHALGHAGIVHQDVDRPDVLLDLLDRRLHAGAAGHVERRRDRVRCPAPSRPPPPRPRRAR